MKISRSTVFQIGVNKINYIVQVLEREHQVAIQVAVREIEQETEEVIRVKEEGREEAERAREEAERATEEAERTREEAERQHQVSIKVSSYITSVKTNS